MENIQEAIKSGEKLLQNLKAEVLFNKNIAYLKGKVPALYEYFKEYVPQKMALVFDESGNVNIGNSNGQLVYPESPISFADKQLNKYANKPGFRIATFVRDAGVDSDLFVHTRMMEKLFEFYKPEYGVNLNVRTEMPSRIQTMVIMGIGLGYHIDKIVNQYDVRNLCIYDPHEDSFYLSLHTVDWQVIIEKFDRYGFNLEFCIGKSLFESYELMSKFFYRIGVYNLIHIYLYKHYDSEDVKALDKLLSEDLQKIAIGIGFFDDERVGLAHTIENLKKKIPVAHRSLYTRKILSGRTAIIVGNGPSLDDNTDFLKRVSGKAYIISCGTSLASLQKKGIKPDIHVEQERNMHVFDWLEGTTKKELRRGIKFVGMNNTYPKVFELFDESYMVAKPNDVGLSLMTDLIDQKQVNTIALADCSNPTVTNFGASLASLLGFKNIVLVGVDLGMKSPDKHHSEDSAYFEHDFDWGQLIKDMGLYQMKGNFSELVWTNHIWDKSRISFETLIKRYGLQCINVNDGLAIKGAHAYRSESLDIEGEHGDSFIDELHERFSLVFCKNGFKPLSEEYVNQYLSNLEKTVRKLKSIICKKVSSMDELYSVLREGHVFLSSKEVNHVSKGLLGGSWNYAGSTLVSILATKEESHIYPVYSEASKIISEHLDLMLEDIVANMYRLDSFTNF